MPFDWPTLKSPPPPPGRLWSADPCCRGAAGPSGTDLALEPELLETPGAGTAGVVADQLPPLGAELVEHRAGVTLLAFRRTAGELDAHAGPLRLRVVGGDDRGVFPRGHP